MVLGDLAETSVGRRLLVANRMRGVVYSLVRLQRRVEDLLPPELHARAEDVLVHTFVD